LIERGVHGGSAEKRQLGGIGQELKRKKKYGL